MHLAITPAGFGVMFGALLSASQLPAQGRAPDAPNRTVQRRTTRSVRAPQRSVHAVSLAGTARVSISPYCGRSARGDGRRWKR